MNETDSTKDKLKKRPFGRFKTENTRNFYNALFFDLGELFLFTGNVLRQFITPPYEHRELLRQCYNIGNKSFSLVSITGFIMGLVLTMQTRPILVMFGAQSIIPSMVSISTFREIGPVITGLIWWLRVITTRAWPLSAMEISITALIVGRRT